MRFGVGVREGGGCDSGGGGGAVAVASGVDVSAVL